MHAQTHSFFIFVQVGNKICELIFYTFVGYIIWLHPDFFSLFESRKYCFGFYFLKTITGSLELGPKNPHSYQLSINHRAPYSYPCDVTFCIDGERNFMFTFGHLGTCFIVDLAATLPFWFMIQIPLLTRNIKRHMGEICQKGASVWGLSKRWQRASFLF